MSKRILITGANGFLGSHIVSVAQKKKYKVRAFVRKNSDLTNLSKLNIEVYRGDLRDIETLKQASDKCDEIFHVAADYRLWAKKPSEIYESNVLGTQNVLEVVKKIGAKLIYTSSVATLGINPIGEANEETPVDLSSMIGDYKKSKYIAEKMVLDYVFNEKVRCVIVNPSTPIGPGDIKPTPTGNIIYHVLKKRMPAYVDTGLNIVNVKDVANGHFLASSKGKIGEKYILGGENLLLKDFLNIISDISNVPNPKMCLPTFPLYPIAFLNEFIASCLTNYEPLLTLDGLKMSEKKMFFSSEKAKKKLGYRPSSIKNAITESINWFINNFKKME